MNLGAGFSSGKPGGVGGGVNFGSGVENPSGTLVGGGGAACGAGVDDGCGKAMPGGGVEGNDESGLGIGGTGGVTAGA